MLGDTLVQKTPSTYVKLEKDVAHLEHAGSQNSTGDRRMVDNPSFDVLVTDLVLTVVKACIQSHRDPTRHYYPNGSDTNLDLTGRRSTYHDSPRIWPSLECGSLPVLLPHSEAQSAPLQCRASSLLSQPVSMARNSNICACKMKIPTKHVQLA